VDATVLTEGRKTNSEVIREVRWITREKHALRELTKGHLPELPASIR